MKMRLLLWVGVTVSAAALAVSTGAQQSGDRVALVIGNAAYPDASTPLSTTISDVRAVAEEFRRDGFDVDLKENVGKEDMRRAIDAFTGKIRSGAAALFYFSGYGIQVARQSYLLPINVQVWTEAEVRREGFSVDNLSAEMQRKGAKVKIIILDAARRNPFERRFRASPAGLAALDTPGGTLAMYSTSPGMLLNEGTGTNTQAGSNSIFASELIRQLRVPRLTGEEVFSRTRIGVSRASNNEQVPWVASTLLEAFSFEAPGPAATPVPEPAHGDAKPGDIVRDCPSCPEMVVVPAGHFDMGSNTEYENPVHRVSIAQPFAMGRYEVTFEEWDRCVEDKGCKQQPDDRGWGRGRRPVINVSWADAKDFVVWLSQKSGRTYRLPSEAEWEYAARAGTNTPFWWGRDAGSRQANCRDCNTGLGQQTLPVGSFQPNPFGLYDTAGNAAEWVEDCWNDNYRGAPSDGTAWTTGQCQLRGLRGGAYDSAAKYVRSSARFRYDNDVRYSANGFRVVREQQPPRGMRVQ
jgi:formylglycine-generating enzyme required for sulfatase activity